jgi:hypothetical protein
MRSSFLDLKTDSPCYSYTNTLRVEPWFIPDKLHFTVEVGGLFVGFSFRAFRSKNTNYITVRDVRHTANIRKITNITYRVVPKSERY